MVLKPSNFKEWLWSAKVLTTIVWILFPLGYITIIRILDVPSLSYMADGKATYLDIFLGPLRFGLPLEVAKILGIPFVFMSPILFMAVLLLFSVYPAIYPSEKFFKKRGSANGVIEYQYIRKILFAFLIALVVTIIALYILIPYANKQLSNASEELNNIIEQRSNLTKYGDKLAEQLRNLTAQAINLMEWERSLPEQLRNMTLQELNLTEQEINLPEQMGNISEQLKNVMEQRSSLNEQQSKLEVQFDNLFFTFFYLYMTVFVLPAVPFFILLKLLLQHARKQFRFYYAKACIEIMNETQSETDKAEYFVLGLNWYNKFIKRVTKSGIDIEAIYTKIISHSQLSNNFLLDTVRDSFNDRDELKPMRHMLTLLSYWKEGATLVKESFRSKIKESSDLLIPIVGVIVTILSSFFIPRPGN